MALFYYQALERNGRKTKGMIEADSARHARQLLRGKELIPVHIEARMNTSSGGMLQRRRHAHRRVAAADLALFTRQLATLVQAAMPLETCLQAVSEQSEKLHVKSLGMALRSRIQEGYTLSDSLREHPRVFDSLFCSMVAAGEKSGHLDVVLNRLADYTEQRQRLKSRLLQAMLYPLVLLVVATGVVTILLTAVVPKIIEQFDHLGHALPATTRALIAMSDALQASGVYWLAGLLALLVLGQRLLKNPAMRLRRDKTLLRLPVTGRVARGLNTARFSRTLSILTASSVPLAESLWEFIDEDRSVQTRLGREDSEYLARSVPFYAANQPLADISEMRVVQGMDAGLYQKLKPLVCALPMTRQQININTLDVTQSVILEALFDPWLSPVQARALLQQRPAKGWEDVDQFLAQPLLADVDERTKKQLKTVLSVDSNYFWLRSDITVNEIELTMNSLIVRMGPQHFSVLWHQTGESE
ncbi:type II secretion system minor pseudopilin GspK [Escherichia coli]